MKLNWAENLVPFETLKTLVLTRIDQQGKDVLTFYTDKCRIFKMSYYPDCCAGCEIEEIHGDLTDLIGSPILQAEVVSSTKPSEEILAKRAKEKAEAKRKNEYYCEEESETWVFYKLATIKGSVTIRWYGSSNGWYSETASFEEVVEELK